GAWGLGVSSVTEGTELRRAGVAAPIVVLGGVFAGEEKDVVASDLEVALWDTDRARALATPSRPVRVHLKVDTGMTRLGLDLSQVREFGELVRGTPGLEIAGAFSHFASADAVDTAAARAQVARFVAARPSALATLPTGYAGGYHRPASNRAQVAVRGRRAPGAGRVCMDHTMIDVTDVEGVERGDRVVLFGDGLPADELAAWCETISYE